MKLDAQALGSYKGGGKRGTLRRRIWLMYFIYKNEYRIFTPVEITVRRRIR
jgi:hypothetical protein